MEARDGIHNAAGTIRLKVAEAMSRDAGRAYARISPEDMEQLGASFGDIVEVAGKRKTVCKVMPALKEARGKAAVQMDGVSRENAGAIIDEAVTIRRVTSRAADQVTLAPVNVTPTTRDLDYIGSLLDGIPVSRETACGRPCSAADGPTSRCRARSRGGRS